MLPLERELMERATAYIEDGVLKKWRHDSVDKSHIDHILNSYVSSKLPLTRKQIEYIIQLDNVIIVRDNSIIFDSLTRESHWIYI